MSQIHEKSPKHCAQRQELNFNKFKKLFFYLSILCLIILCFIILLFILNPSKPKFFLKEVNIHKFNFTSPSFLNSSIDLTFLSKNPNKMDGIYYDDFILYASYKGQKITPETSITAFYQGHDETNLISASLMGEKHVVPLLANEVQRDRGTGKLELNFEGMGWHRWKAGVWVSRRSRISVNCIIIMPFGIGSTLSYTSTSKHGIMCSTSV
ncbi:hypothetical protein CDL12_13720 [Handroanthus impetiginosus]|uniref:Late embryogenesis abundant protein LEA-2 subgroup domain-containing protein n=1 Tax=Handroanthus impetiginosus TaxID=429701 RepID=A0A2G9H813_9LAMI|nr:hypothetical protein CDL12_13720 [Handroanthus impetiginosus]